MSTKAAREIVANDRFVCRASDGYFDLEFTTVATADARFVKSAGPGKFFAEDSVRIEHARGTLLIGPDVEIEMIDAEEPAVFA